MAAYIRHFFGIGIPAACVFACFAPYRMRALRAQRLHSCFLREATLYLFVAYLFGLAALVLWPQYILLQGNLVILNARKSFTDGVNWVPFYMIRGYIQALEEGNLYYGLVYFAGNIAAFMPLGFLLPLLFRNQGPIRVFLIGLGYSLTAEYLQFFLGRHCDVDDVMLNALGSILGYLSFRLFKWLFPVFAEYFRCRKSK